MTATPRDTVRDCQRLTALLRDIPGRLLVAYSGGVDSGLLLHAAVDARGPDQVMAATVSSPLQPDAGRQADDLPRRLRVAHHVVAADELSNPEIVRNDPLRCYYCKHYKFKLLREFATRLACDTVIEGSNADDVTAGRPGLKVLHELGVYSPLAEAGFSKTQVRAMARRAGLPMASRPADACLATRIPTGEPLDSKRLQRIGQAEAFLHDRGLTQVRARDHGNLLRIEADPHEIARCAEEAFRVEATDFLQALGWRHITLDLQGYRCGSMDAPQAPADGGRHLP